MLYRLFGIAAVACLLTGCSDPGSATHSDPLAPITTPVDQHAAAEKLRDSLVGGHTLLLATHVTKGSINMVVVSRMWPGRCRMDAYKDGQRFFATRCGGDPGEKGRVQEWIPDRNIGAGAPKTNIVVEYEANHGDSSDWPGFMDAGEACACGSSFESWLGDGAQEPALLAQFVEEGKLLGVRRADGKDRLVFEKVTVDQHYGADSFKVTHRVEIDAATYELRRWETTQTTRWRSLTRADEYLKVVRDGVGKSDWGVPLYKEIAPPPLPPSAGSGN